MYCSTVCITHALCLMLHMEVNSSTYCYNSVLSLNDSCSNAYSHDCTVYLWYTLYVNARDCGLTNIDKGVY